MTRSLVFLIILLDRGTRRPQYCSSHCPTPKPSIQKAQRVKAREGGGSDITKTRREDRWLFGAFRPKKRERVRMFVQETPPIERETFVFLTYIYIRISEGVCVARTRLRPELADKLYP